MFDLAEFVTLNHNVLVTDSRRVAKHFKKLHKNVLRAYDRLDCDAEFNQLNFEPVEEVDEKGEMRRLVRMTKDGFMLLVMGFTGPKATEVKVAYIRAFNSMSDQLQRVQNDLWYQMLDLERREAFSQSWASFGSRCMLRRKREKPLLQNERNLLEERLQPELSLEQASAQLPH
jgi:Rha family phage regulatory protein